MIRPKRPRSRRITRAELGIAGFALLLLLVGEATVSATIRGTNFAGADGKMAEAVIRAAFRLAAPFDVTNLNHIQGVGSLLLPFNVWANPAYWPFAIIQGDRAAEVSGLIALACFAIATYVMTRCFDLSPFASAVAAQSGIVLFGPLVLLASATSVFALQPGFAVVYAPLMVALGVLARINPGRIGPFILRTGLILLLLLYGIYSDPLWSIIGGISWSAAFMTVAFSPLRCRPILIRCAPLGCCIVVLLASGVLEYVYTLPRYTARVEFASLLVRPANIAYASVLFSSEYAKYWYSACVLGWVLGLFALRGRPRVLVVAGVASFAFLFAYSTAFLLLQPDWSLPLPIYIEQCMWQLFTAAGVAGYWGALQQLGVFARHVIERNDLDLHRVAPVQPVAAAQRRSLWRVALSATTALAILTAVPGTGMWAASSNQRLATSWVLGWPDETQLGDFLSQNIGARVGETFRGSAVFPSGDYFDLLSMSNLWKRGIPTANEYSQLVTPQMIYLNAALFRRNVASDLNHFTPWLGGAAFETWFKALQALGVRYLITSSRFPQADQDLMPAATFTGRKPRGPYGAYELGKWEVYEFPVPNLGNYSPTHIVAADSAAEIIARLGEAGFDFRRDVVVSGIIEALVPAREMHLSITRAGLHFSGESAGTSLVLLPQQFFNCLRSSDGNVRIVRANLTSAALLFSGKVETEITIAYGLFSPACRRDDLVDLNRLRVALSSPADKTNHNWEGIKEQLRAAMRAIK
jgi:hypothetical protein